MESYKYSKIQNIVNGIFRGSNQFGNKTYELNTISTIVSQINEDTLKEIDKKINIENQNSFYCSYELINIQGKAIPLYKSFILINEKLNEHFQKYFLIKPNYEILHYKKGIDGDYIILENYPSSNQNYPYLNIILFGIIQKNECKFDIKGIFDYFSNESLNIEKNDLINYGHLYYLSGRTVLNHYDKKDLISPIFLNDEIVGNYYKYEKCDYNKCINYMAYYNNKLLQNIIYLYINEKEINNNIKGTSFKDGEYYLIKKQVLKDFKEKCDYEKLKHMLEGKITNIPKDKKDLYSIIKSIPINQLNQFSSNNNNINLNNASSIALVINQSKSLPELDTIDFEVNCIPIQNPINQNQTFMVYDNFELIK